MLGLVVPRSRWRVRTVFVVPEGIVVVAIPFLRNWLLGPSGLGGKKLDTGSYIVDVLLDMFWYMVSRDYQFICPCGMYFSK